MAVLLRYYYCHLCRVFHEIDLPVHVQIDTLRQLLEMVRKREACALSQVDNLTREVSTRSHHYTRTC